MVNRRLIGVAVSLLPAMVMAQELELTPAQQTLVSEIPTTGAARAREIFTELNKDADTLVPMFASRLTTQKSDADTTSRYALGGFVWTVGHSGSDKEKAKLAELIADAIDKPEGAEPKSFLVEQLQFLGQDSIAPRLYPLISNPELGSRAVRTLAALQPDDLAEKFIAALDGTATTETKAGMLLSLAQLAPAKAQAAAMKHAADADPDVREAALDVLAAIGNPDSRDLLKSSAAKSATFNDKLAPARYLAYARALAANKHEDLAAEVCHEVAKMEHAPDALYLQGTAVTVLAEIAGEKALDDLLEYAKNDREDVRAGALAAINRFKSEAITQRLTAALEQSPDPEVSEAILLALGDRKDASALPAVVAHFTDETSSVAVAAVAAAGEIDRAKALSALVDASKSTEDSAVLDASVKQLLRANPADMTKAVGEAIASAKPANQVALIGLLGERRATAQKAVVFDATKSEDQKVRSAAYEALGRVAESEDLPRLRDTMLSAQKSSDRSAARKAFVAAAKDSDDALGRATLLNDSFHAADDKVKETVLETMAAIADEATLPLVTEAANSTATEELQDAAIRALADWQSKDAVAPLLHVVSKSKSDKHKILAVRGLVRLAGDIKNGNEKFALLEKIVPHVKTPDEAIQVLNQLGNFHGNHSLKLVAPFVGREGVAPEAAAAALKVAMPGKGQKGASGAEAIEILQKALPAITDKEQRREAEKQIYKLITAVNEGALPVDSEGFSLLFNGKDLTGWCGDTSGYSVENGVLVCNAETGGKLFSEREYGDFILRFEFKLPAGANNGVGIRTPIAGDPAYSGMEIQLLDDKDPKYKDIKDWQRHGSVYGVHPAQPADLKIGEWNTEEISCIGRNIKVTVNGKVINEVNLDEAKAKGFPSGKEHPGVDRNSGHVGFLGHGAKVEFRNVRIKNVANTPPEGYTALFNGSNLEGWKGLVANPIKRKAMSEADLAKAQEKADGEMNAHWSVDDGILFFDGDGSHLCTTKDYGNFEMLVDWRIPPGGDNGIYLRGAPQVQIWDPYHWPQGSGGLYNNQKGTSDPLVLADNPIGQWNTFKIKMVDDKVTVHLNDKLVVDNVVLENYWDRKQPIFPVEQLELQSHGSPAWFRNVYIKELP